MKAILLSIKPEYANKILAGSKRYEYRKRIANGDIKKIIIYSSSPEKKIVGEVSIIETLAMKRTPLWEKTKTESGISRLKFREYFRDSKIAYAYHLGEVIKFNEPKSLPDYGLTQAPQSFVYVEI